MRFRYIYMGLGTILITLIMILSDPDLGIIKNLPIGAGTLATFIILLKSILYVGALHLSRRALIDYVDLKKYFKMALQSSTGSGSAIVGVGLIMISISIVIVGSLF